MRSSPPPPGPELDLWVHEAIVDAETWLQSLPAWKRHWLEFKWFRIDPLICRLRCWWTGDTCPWEP